VKKEKNDKKRAADKTVQRPDLAEIHGTGPTEETHDEGEHRPGDAPHGTYTGEHGATLPRPKPRG
jgi:hypothetical protein